MGRDLFIIQNHLIDADHITHVTTVVESYNRAYFEISVAGVEQPLPVALEVRGTFAFYFDTQWKGYNVPSVCEARQKCKQTIEAVKQMHSNVCAMWKQGNGKIKNLTVVPGACPAASE